MIPYDIDPSLHAIEPQSPLLEDGFSSPRPAKGPQPPPGTPPASLEDALASKSEF